jgi:hypothetical protein
VSVNRVIIHLIIDFLKNISSPRKKANVGIDKNAKQGIIRYADPTNPAYVLKGGSYED